MQLLLFNEIMIINAEIIVAQHSTRAVIVGKFSNIMKKMLFQVLFVNHRKLFKSRFVFKIRDSRINILT